VLTVAPARIDGTESGGVAARECGVAVGRRCCWVFAEEGLRYLREAADRHKLQVERGDGSEADSVAGGVRGHSAGGARNMQNLICCASWGGCASRSPVIVRRPECTRPKAGFGSWRQAKDNFTFRGRPCTAIADRLRFQCPVGPAESALAQFRPQAPDTRASRRRGPTWRRWSRES
jgi:hypothetical protein